MKRILSLFLILTLLLIIPVYATNEPAEWAKDSIEYLENNNVVSENILGNYTQPITRQEFATILVEMIEYSNDVKLSSEESVFTDINNEYINKAHANGIIDGIGNDLFNPNGNLTREQLAVMFNNALKLTNLEEKEIIFSDEDCISSWAVDAVKKAYCNNLIGGVGNNKVDPQGTATREQALTITCRTIKNILPPKIEVDGGNLSGDRKANVRVNVGHGDRVYWAYTNEYSQLIKVTADQIILQDDDTEDVTSAGRYYYDEAKVPGTEAADLDEGHIIADSLGGNSNAYNICPQNSTLNRHGDQAYMENAIRTALKDGGTCTNFTAIITYPNINTMIPSHYDFYYTLNENKIHDSFDNINSDTAPIVENTTEVVINDSNVSIKSVDKKLEFVVLENNSTENIDLKGYKIVSVLGNQTYIFDSYVLKSGDTVKIGDSKKNSDIDLYWLCGRGTWNNSKSDPAELYNKDGELIDKYND